MKTLLAIDGSQFSDAAVQAVAERARPDDEILVLYVVEPPSLFVSHEMGGYNMAEGSVTKDDEREGNQLVTEVSDRLQSKGLKVMTAIEHGDAKSVIIETASKWRADLVVLASHGRKGLERFLLGGVSSAVARNAPCSVEVVRILPS